VSLLQPFPEFSDDDHLHLSVIQVFIPGSCSAGHKSKLFLTHRGRDDCWKLDMLDKPGNLICLCLECNSSGVVRLYSILPSIRITLRQSVGKTTVSFRRFIRGLIGKLKARSTSIYQIVFDTIMSQLGIAFHVHFLQNAGAIRANGFFAERQPFGNLLHGFPRRDRA